ncbi:ABC transporter substrate-binding protein [Deinococcus wulumuqiensis]|uniref:Branched-chain amino acid ABC transporter substrate-binding protein n=1 Tax=Deinococcus wulumuqiensis TaxID=980427 RepID=A0AAV4K2W0_9DEIO|nr:ABC transporter substrate-binding protein [Deinococcus wulumuqiensis]QII19435.1 ABC transporter substrate-binding protein [Deinococcus wulumuqiensis R12]GGI76711.1 branched-chain amino acid ABC transporter substrate-binding protein [Deinococcus wulumuqiensis]GGP29272.1 branched-chain amino acid ABC transporter substrate-binding protein [Deinococcus wulumuqiensis]
MNNVTKLLVLGAALASAPAAAQKVSSISLGVAVAQTSNVSLFGQEQVAGAKVAEKLINAAGGVNGTPIKLVYQDAGGDENGAINAFQSLINKSRVLGIVGPTLSQQAFAADPVAERAKVPVLGISNTAKGIPQIGTYVARVSAPIAVIAPAAVKQALKLNPKIKKVAVMYAQNDAFSVSETETFQSTLKAQGLNIVTVQKSLTTDTDFTTQVTAVINSGAELVVVSALAADGGNIVKQLRQFGYKGLIVGGNGFNTANVFPVCQKDCDGVLVAQAYSPSQKSAVNQKFVSEYRKLYKKDPPQFAAQAYAGIQVFVDALKVIDKKKKLSTWDLAALRTELNKQVLAGKYSTPLGELRFDKDGEVNQKEFFVARIKMKDAKNGSFVFDK